MTKNKFYYDPKTVSYKPVQVSLRVRIFKNIVVVFGLILVAFLGFIGFSFVIKTPKVVSQQREIENLKINYELLTNRIESATKVLREIQDRDDNIYRVYFEANPIPKEQRMAGFGGINRYKSLEGYENSKIVKNLTKKVDILSKQLVVQSKSLDKIVRLAKDKNKMLASIPAIQPIANKQLNRIASGFGYRYHPIYKRRHFHGGMDFSAPIGTPIYATGKGKVIVAKKSFKGYGYHVQINHGYGYKTLYAHMHKIIVRERQKVKRGDLIGYVGTTGRSTGPHLHYEVIKNNRRVNPVYYYHNDLSPEEYAQVLEISARENQSYD